MAFRYYADYGGALVMSSGGVRALLPRLPLEKGKLRSLETCCGEVRNARVSQLRLGALDSSSWSSLESSSGKCL